MNTPKEPAPFSSTRRSFFAALVAPLVARWWKKPVPKTITVIEFWPAIPARSYVYEAQGKSGPVKIIMRDGKVLMPNSFNRLSRSTPPESQVMSGMTGRGGTGQPAHTTIIRSLPQERAGG